MRNHHIATHPWDWNEQDRQYQSITKDVQLSRTVSWDVSGTELFRKQGGIVLKS